MPGLGLLYSCTMSPRFSASAATSHTPAYAFVRMPAPVLQLYLPRESLEGTDITTAKSSEVNVVVPRATGKQASSTQHA